MNTSINHSGVTRITKQIMDVGVQTDSVVVDQLNILENKKIGIDKIKAACATVSTNSGISVENARKAVMNIMKTLHNHNAYLSPEEKREAYNVDVVADEPLVKKPRKVPRSKVDYEHYTYILLSARAISDYNYMQSSQVELNAVKAVYCKESCRKCTLHYDSTQQNSIAGDWPTLILVFSDGSEYRLCSPFFAYKDYQQIPNLIVETYKRLAAGSMTCDSDVTTALLWKNAMLL